MKSLHNFYPGLVLAPMSLLYCVLVVSPSHRNDMVSILLPTAFGVSELIVFLRAVITDLNIKTDVWRLLNVIGALSVAAAAAGSLPTAIDLAGTAVLTLGLVGTGASHKAN